MSNQINLWVWSIQALPTSVSNDLNMHTSPLFPVGGHLSRTTCGWERHTQLCPFTEWPSVNRVWPICGFQIWLTFAGRAIAKVQLFLAGAQSCFGSVPLTKMDKTSPVPLTVQKLRPDILDIVAATMCWSCTYSTCGRLNQKQDTGQLSFTDICP